MEPIVVAALQGALIGGALGLAALAAAFIVQDPAGVLSRLRWLLEDIARGLRAGVDRIWYGR